MAYRPSDLAKRMSKGREPDDGFSRETFRLPVGAARVILDQLPQDSHITIVEHWQQLPDGQIEFTMRRMRIAN